MQDDSYLTVRKPSQAEFVEKKSRFIGHISPATTEEEAIKFIDLIKKEHHSATHNVPVYIIRDTGVKRYSDDGEPQGTAGIPMLDVIEKKGLTNLVIVATRYFGGTLLGAGGLVRAYTKSAAIAIESTEIVRMQKATEIELKMEYSFFDQVQNMLKYHTHTILNEEFLADVTIDLYIPTDEYNNFEKEIISLSSGRIKPVITGERFAEFKI